MDTYEVTEFEPLARLVMRTAQRPFPVQTTTRGRPGRRQHTAAPAKRW